MRRDLASTLTALLMGALAAPAIAQGASATQPADKTHAHADKECPADCAKACCADLSEMVKGYEEPDLWIGDDAPKLHVAKFVKGDSVQALQEGQTYVVEFWATWCRPCIEAFPHLSKLQKEHKDKVTFLGVNIFDTKRDESQAARVDRVSQFVADQGDRMGYTVAIEDGKKMGETWMAPAGQNGIPAAFIVNGKGKIAWIGHPMTMDEPLGQIIAGEYDIQKAATEAKNQKLAQLGFQQFGMAVTQGDEAQAKEAYKLARAIARQVLWDEPDALNAIAWPVLDNPAVQHRDYEFALMAAERAKTLTNGEDAQVLDTYALALYKTGDVHGAIKAQKKALELAPEDEPGRAEMQERLDKYQSEKP